MWLACYTLDEIGEEVTLDKANVSRKIKTCCETEKFPKRNKLKAYEQCSMASRKWKISSIKKRIS